MIRQRHAFFKLKEQVAFYSVFDALNNTALFISATPTSLHLFFFLPLFIYMCLCVCDCSHVRVRPAEALTAVSLFDVEPCRIRPSPSGALLTACTHTLSPAHKHTHKQGTHIPTKTNASWQESTHMENKLSVLLFTQELRTCHRAGQNLGWCAQKTRPQTFHHSQAFHTFQTNASRSLFCVLLFNKHKCKSLWMPPIWGFCTMVHQKHAHTDKHACRQNVGHSERIYSRSQNYRRGCIPFGTAACWHNIARVTETESFTKQHATLWKWTKTIYWLSPPIIYWRVNVKSKRQTIGG